MAMMRTILLLGALLICACISEWDSSDGGGGEPVPRADQACLECHQDAARDMEASGRHRGQGCLTCHVAHAEGEPAAAAKDCSECHADVDMEFALPFKHPEPEGCLTCHSAHGASRLEMREALREETCVECHIEYKGPFLFEHEGPRGAGCMGCHQPHGASNRRLLNFADTRSLCMSCHMTLEAVHIQNPGSIFKDCLLCHTEVHGSNWSREFYR